MARPFWGLYEHHGLALIRCYVPQAVDYSGRASVRLALQAIHTNSAAAA